MALFPFQKLFQLDKTKKTNLPFMEGKTSIKGIICYAFTSTV